MSRLSAVVTVFVMFHSSVAQRAVTEVPPHTKLDGDGQYWRSMTVNERFTNCCSKRREKNAANIEADCIDYCEYDHFNRRDLTRAFRVKACPPRSLANLLYCASRWQDHSECCTREGMPPNCLIMCRPAKERLSMDVKYAVCLRYFHIGERCFREYDAAHPQYHRVERVNPLLDEARREGEAARAERRRQWEAEQALLTEQDAAENPPPKPTIAFNEDDDESEDDEYEVQEYVDDDDGDSTSFEVELDDNDSGEPPAFGSVGVVQSQSRGPVPAGSAWR